MSQQSPIDFPCLFPIKAMGLSADDFDALVVSIVSRHGATIAEGAVSSRPSSNGKYLSVTVTITAENQQQLDAIYRDLTAHERVLMAL